MFKKLSRPVFIKCLLLMYLIAGWHFAYGKKSCSYTNLSRLYDYSITVNKSDEKTGTVTVVVMLKADKSKKQVITFQPQDWFMLKFDCWSRSYITGVNKDKLAEDGDCGDIVVADVNFDGKEDIAIRDEFTNGYGQLYRFFFQDDKGRFIEQHDFLGQGADDCLTKTFPAKINARARTLSFWGQPDAYTGSTTTFEYSVSAHKWKKITVRKDHYKNGKIIKHTIEKK